MAEQLDDRDYLIVPNADELGDAWQQYRGLVMRRGARGQVTEAEDGSTRVNGFVNADQILANNPHLQAGLTETGAKFGLQLGHAGRKGSTKVAWEGTDQPLDEGNWPLISASALPYLPHSQIPREMTRGDMERVKADFVRAMHYAVKIGFDIVELHVAHGYLLSSFLSPLTNLRQDAYIKISETYRPMVSPLLFADDRKAEVKKNDK